MLFLFLSILGFSCFIEHIPSLGYFHWFSGKLIQFIGSGNNTGQLLSFAVQPWEGAVCNKRWDYGHLFRPRWGPRFTANPENVKVNLFKSLRQVPRGLSDFISQFFRQIQFGPGYRMNSHRWQRLYQFTYGPVGRDIAALGSAFKLNRDIPGTVVRDIPGQNQQPD